MSRCQGSRVREDWLDVGARGERGHERYQPLYMSDTRSCTRAIDEYTVNNLHPNSTNPSIHPSIHPSVNESMKHEMFRKGMRDLHVCEQGASVKAIENGARHTPHTSASSIRARLASNCVRIVVGDATRRSARALAGPAGCISCWRGEEANKRVTQEQNESESAGVIQRVGNSGHSGYRGGNQWY